MNPEFQRNLWLEASPRRLAWTAVVLGLVYGAVALAGRDGDPAALRSALAAAGGVIFVVCAVVWASRAAGKAVLTEIAERTWDFQRLSALTPWTMTWGKLAGASSLAWIAGLSGLAVLVAVGLIQGSGPQVLWTAAGLLAGAVLLQSLSMGAALVGVRKARAEGRVAQARGVLGGLLIGLVLLSLFAGSRRFEQAGPDLSRLFDGQPIMWWDMLMTGPAFTVLSLAVFGLWAIVGAWRLMRLELQMENSPGVWKLFLIFLAFWLAGFAEPGAARWYAATAAMALAAYAAAFAEPADRVHARQFIEAIVERKLSRLMFRVPAALPPAVFAAICAFAGALAAPADHLGMAGALTAFMVRDLGIIAFFRFGSRPQRGDFSAVVALALVYGVGGIVGASFSGMPGVALFTPSPVAPLLSIVSALVQALPIWIMVLARLRRPDQAPA